MSQLSNYGENKLIDFLFRGQSLTAPASWYVALLTTACVDSDTGTTLTSGSGGSGVEVTGGSYARTALNPSTTNWVSTQGDTSSTSTGTGGQTSNGATITFPTATGSWGTIAAIAILDASTNGNMWWYGNLSASKTVASGDIVQFTAGSLTVTVA